MKKQVVLPGVVLLGGAAAFMLRLLQNHTGFEPDTGLPIPGAAIHLVMAGALVLLGAVLLLLVRQLPAESGDGPAFPTSFSTDNAGLLTLTVMGVFLLAASGALDLLAGLGIVLPSGADALVLTNEGLATLSGFTPKEHLFLGVLSLAAAFSLFPAAAACRHREEQEAPKAALGSLLLVPPACLVIRLVVAYRACSVDPALEAYYVQLLALVFLTLGFYRLSSFAFKAGRTRRFALYAGAAVALSVATLADGHSLPVILFYVGGGAALLGFLLLRLAGPAWVPPAEPAPPEEDT